VSIKPEHYRFDAHEGSDCTMCYIRRPARPYEQRTAAIVYGPVRYSVVLRWKEGGMEAYLQRLHDLGLIQRSAQ